MNKTVIKPYGVWAHSGNYGFDGNRKSFGRFETLDEAERVIDNLKPEDLPGMRVIELFYSAEFSVETILTVYLRNDYRRL